MRSNFASCFLFLVGALCWIAPAAAQEFQAWEGNAMVYEGQGGTRKTVDGIDFWENGSPPRKFMLIGYITDRRHKTGLVGMISMSNLESDVAEVVKKVGGDAVILVDASAETTGVVGNAWSNPNGPNAWGTATPVQKQNSKYAVIKYLPDDRPATPVAPAPPVSSTPIPD